MINKNYKFAIIIHLYYEDVWWEIKNKIKNYQNYDLYISIGEYLSNEVKNDIYNTKKNVNFFVFENKGMDIGPFIKIFDIIKYKNYDFFIKVHTKKGLKYNQNVRDHWDKWRKDLFDKLLPTYDTLNGIYFDMKKQNIKISTSSNWVDIISRSSGIESYENFKENVLDLGFDDTFTDYEYCQGSMFIGEFKTYSQFFKDNDSEKIYDKLTYAYHKDLTFTHQMERIISLIGSFKNKVYKL